MADEFKTQITKRCGIAGPHCRCCNPYGEGVLKPLKRSVRRSLKLADAREVKELLRNII